MNKKIILLALICALGFTVLIVKTSAAKDALVLARVIYPKIESLKDLPVHALLQDEQGNEYALVLARLSQLEQCGLAYEILDFQPAGATYWLVSTRRSNAKPPAFGRWLYHDGLVGVIRIVGKTAYTHNAWQSAGYELLPLPDDPLVLNTTPASALAIADYNPDIANMISQVITSTVYTLTGQLSGDWQTVIGGAPYIFTTRNSYNSAAIEKATQFAFETLQSYGITPTYQTWSVTGLPNMRNVIGELPGNLAADEIILITAHIDDLPKDVLAPGADDNASGTVGVLTAAEILSQYEFERTLRFVIFTGEEQGLYGSQAYAEQVSNLGEDIVAVLNLDMIAWEDIGEPVVNLHTRADSNPGYSQDLFVANAFTSVVNDYGLSSYLSPKIIDDGLQYSDHFPFWNKGYPAILAIEDDNDDFNPNYHTSNDKLSALNMAYYVNFVRAAVGTAATLALPIAEDEIYIRLPLVINSISDQ